MAYDIDIDVRVDAYGKAQNDHTLLINRDAENQHPISAIENLQSVLDSKVDTSTFDDTMQEVATKDDITPKEYEFTIDLDTSKSSTTYDTQIHLNPARPLYIQMYSSPELSIGLNDAIGLEAFPTTVDDIIAVFFSKFGGWASSQFQSSDGNYMIWAQGGVDLSKTLKLYFYYNPAELSQQSVTVKLIN